MPFTDLIGLHFTAAEINSITAALNTIQTTLESKAKNLTPEERKQYGSISEYNKLLVQKVRDYRNSQSALSSPDVNWVEFEADWIDRNFLESFINRLETLAEIATDTKILHDYDVYQASLTDYDYTKYKMNTNALGFDTKYHEIKQFFPNTGGGNQHNATSGKEE